MANVVVISPRLLLLCSCRCLLSSFDDGVVAREEEEEEEELGRCPLFGVAAKLDDDDA